MTDVAINIGVIEGEDPEHFVVVADRLDPPARRPIGDLRRDGETWRLTPQSPLDFEPYKIDAQALEDACRQAQQFAWDMFDLEGRARGLS